METTPSFAAQPAGEGQADAPTDRIAYAWLDPELEVAAYYHRELHVATNPAAALEIATGPVLYRVRCDRWMPDPHWLGDDVMRGYGITVIAAVDASAVLPEFEAWLTCRLAQRSPLRSAVARCSGLVSAALVLLDPTDQAAMRAEMDRLLAPLFAAAESRDV